MKDHSELWSAPFIIYKSSAGSGKTYTLTAEYLKLALRYDNYHKHILAVTFTNKATKELKERVLESLYQVTCGNISGLTLDVMRDLEISEREFKKRCSRLLYLLLHEYSGFNISTIDSFFQKIIRSFTREGGIQANYQLEIDVESSLLNAVDRTFNEIGKDEILTQWMVEFTLKKIEDGSNWDLHTNLFELGKQLMSEDFKEIQLKSKSSAKVSLQDFYRELVVSNKSIISEVKMMGKEGLDLISSHGLQISDFFQNMRGVGGHFKELSIGHFKEPNGHVKKAIDENKWYSAKAPNKDIIDQCVSDGLYDVLLKYSEYFDNTIKTYLTNKELVSQFYQLAVSDSILNNLNDYLLEEGRMLLSDSSTFLRSVIGENETPFIYEKTGSWFKHYLIDEFQDTSRLQWMNFLPLIKDSLDNMTISMIVGDVKQSIYRFRGSDWQLLNSEVYKDVGQNRISTQNLDKNYRSTKNVIDFNNDFFERCIDLYNNNRDPDKDFEASSEIKDIYNDVRQGYGSKFENEGFVSVDVMDKTLEEERIQLILNKVREIQKRGVPPGEIAILVRFNKDAEPIVNALLEAEKSNEDEDISYSVVSEELMNLNKSPVINFLLTLLRIFDNPNDDILTSTLLMDYAHYFIKKENSIDYLVHRDKESWHLFLPEEFQILFKDRNFISVSELIEKFVRIFELHRVVEDQPFICCFQDQILNYFENGPGDIHSFLDWWDSAKERKVAISEFPDAVRIMTIHKAKGLQFGAVILPKIDWNFTGRADSLFFKSDIKPYSELPFISLTYKKDMALTHFQPEYEVESGKRFVDVINLLYVGFTRAIFELHIIALESESESNVNSNSLKDAGSLVSLYKQTYLKEGVLGSQNNIAKHDKKLTKRYDFSNYQTSDWNETVKVSASELIKLNEDKASKINIGVQIHKIFSEIDNLDTIEEVFNRFKKSNKLPPKEIQTVFNEVREILKNDQVKKWFSLPNYRESSFLTEDGEHLRPDKIVFEGDRISVIDFKTGVEHEKHVNQLNKYKVGLKTLSNKKINGFILYTNPFKIISI